MSLLRIAINLLVIISIIVIFQSIMNFLAIDPSTYLVFLVWLIALILFYYILPRKYIYFNT
jgi:uncharacterized protein (DUF983 family)